jgi:hypothetical protein
MQKKTNDERRKIGDRHVSKPMRRRFADADVKSPTEVIHRLLFNAHSTGSNCSCSLSFVIDSDGLVAVAFLSVIAVDELSSG